MNKCNCLLLCACPGDLASHFNANSIALCINDRLNAISKIYEGTVGSLRETNESGLCFDGFVFVLAFASDPIIFKLSIHTPSLLSLPDS